jgi:hypothetical protein
MGIQELRMCVCDDCGAMETMPLPEITETEVIVMFVPKDWVGIMGEQQMRSYCPACKYLHEQ